MQSLNTRALDMSPTVDGKMVGDFLVNATRAIRSTYHIVLKSTPGAPIFGRDVLFDIPYVADWVKLDIVDKSRWNAPMNMRTIIIYPMTMQKMTNILQ